MTRATGAGRKPVPTNLKLLRGNPGRRPLNPREAKPAVKLPTPPAHLSKEARKEWRRTGRFLLEVGLITELDRAAFAAFCTAWARWVEAEDALRNFGIVLKSPSGFPIQSPYLAIANKAMEQMRSLLSEFGMSPASRSRVTAAPAPVDEDPFEAFLSERR
jgi:P27 family predicted phage terminase small subunit